MCLTHFRRDNRLGYGFADDIVSGESEHLDGGIVELDDQSFHVNRDHGIHRAVKDRLPKQSAGF